VASGCSDEDSDLSGSDNDDATWVSWFCSLKGNEFFVEVDEDFIQDDFNLTGLSTQVRPRRVSSCGPGAAQAVRTSVPAHRPQRVPGEVASV
jgi:hypothetical protein